MRTKRSLKGPVGQHERAASVQSSSKSSRRRTNAFPLSFFFLRSRVSLCLDIFFYTNQQDLYKDFESLDAAQKVRKSERCKMEERREDEMEEERSSLFEHWTAAASKRESWQRFLLLFPQPRPLSPSLKKKQSRSSSSSPSASSTPPPTPSPPPRPSSTPRCPRA